MFVSTPVGRPASRLTDAYGLLDVILHTRLKLGCAGWYGLNLNAVGVGWQCVASLFRLLTLNLDAAAVAIVRVAALRSILALVLVTIVRVAALRSILTLDLVTIATIVVTGVVTVATVVVAMILVVEVILMILPKPMPGIRMSHHLLSLEEPWEDPPSSGS